MKDMIIFPEDIERLNAVLGPLVMKSKLLLAVLINRDGRILTHQGGLEQVDIVSLAALVAGNSASTLAIANLVGETEFFAMYHQGKDKNIYIDAVDDNTFLSVVFNDQTNIDRVKVFVRQFERQLKEALRAVYDKDEDQIDLDLDMGNGSFQNIPQEQQYCQQSYQQQPMPGNGYGYQQGQQYPPQQQPPNEPPPPPPESESDKAYQFLHAKKQQGSSRGQQQ